MPHFKAKARAVDLLGKGQIADLPTAISELWKNGYDAYADKLGATLYLPGYEDTQSPIFVISDDGKGMSYDDIINKWIVLGTDSKSRDNQIDEKGPETLGKEPRPRMGEKGIGRLSVAYLGSPMLMLTKKINEPLQALYFDWRILENYNLFLDAVNIPVGSITDADTASTAIYELRDTFLANFNSDDIWHDQLKTKEKIIVSSENLYIPNFIIKEIVNENILENTHGTWFIIFDPDEQIIEFSKEAKKIKTDSSVVNDVQQGLSALFNFFIDDREAVDTEFVIKSTEPPYSLVKKEDFFTVHDFSLADHLIEGFFNSNGQFSGKIKVYDQEILDYTFNPIRYISAEKGTTYGPFEIKLGYLPGKEHSFLAEDQYDILNEKLKKFGALYIYRDGIRVLPYGRVDADFLGFEEKRSKRISTYFFSYRRMFGYIGITRKNNKLLADKAGREGFISNAAFRDFKADLSAFFEDLAKKYFSIDATSDYRKKKLTELEAQKKEEKHRKQMEEEEKKREREEKKQWSTQLTDNSDQLKVSRKDLEEVNRLLGLKVKEVSMSYDEIKAYLRRIDGLKANIKKLEIETPKRFQPSIAQKEKMLALNAEIGNLLNNTLAESDSIIQAAQAKLKEEELLQEYANKANFYLNRSKTYFQQEKSKLAGVLQRFSAVIDDEQRTVQAELEKLKNRYQPGHPSLEEVQKNISLLEAAFTEIQAGAEHKLETFIGYLSKLTPDRDEDALTGFHKLEYEKQKQEADLFKDLAQLGMAVEIIDHQFNVLYSQLSYSIENFGNLVAENPGWNRSYKEMRHAFEHLEDNYRLITPLYRTSGRIQTRFSCASLHAYITQFFAEQIKEMNIDIQTTPAFSTHSIFSVESVFKPVLVNIVNNAIYWLRPVSDRKIVMDVHEDEILIMNSGMPISDAIIDGDIFKLFFSRRPNGRGIGLYLAKTSLESIGYTIYATNAAEYNRLGGACFVIKPANQ